jgi:dimethyl sulfoxide reductase iron-sulfur subunit
MTGKRMVMLIDLKRCIGCHTCAMACKVGNDLPEQIWWNRVLTHGGEHMDTPRGTFPNLKLQYLTLACQNCDDPACVKACPAGATHKRPDGVVMQDYELCLGCGMCILACPYKNVRQLNEVAPKYTLDFPIGDAAIIPQQKGTVSKCCFCFHRLDEQSLPNCIGSCPARARHMGDLNDPNSEVSRLLGKKQHMQLLTEHGTKPSVYFLI